MEKKDYFNELYKRYGKITRARNCFLYTSKGVRITDLYQEDGRAILGWRGDSSFTLFKNFLTKGITGSFICEDFSRVQKAVNQFFEAKFSIFYFCSKKEALKEAIHISPEKTAVWRPWLSEKVQWNKNDCLVIAPALPWTDTIYILAVKENLCNELKTNSISIPYPLEVSIARSFYNLKSEISKREEKEWFIYDTVLTKYFTRKGPYLYPKIPQEKYDDFVIHCMNQGIAINPDFNNPSIVPYGADKGVFSKLKNSPFIY